MRSRLRNVRVVNVMMGDDGVYCFVLRRIQVYYSVRGAFL